MRYTLKRVDDHYECPYCGKAWPSPITNRSIPESELDPARVEAANKEVMENCPHAHDQRGNSRRLTMADHDYPCRRRWMDAYLAYRPLPPRRIPRDPVERCPDKGTLVVTVLDEARSPLDAASVYVWEPHRKDRTNWRGRARFDCLLPRSYRVHAWKGTTEISGYTYIYKEEQTGSPTVIVDREVFCEIVLQKYLAGDLEVFVIDEHNNPIPGATVILNPATFKPSNLELKNSSRKTERTGEAVFLKLPYGDYTVEAVHKEGSARSAQKTTRIFKPGMHPRVTIMIDFTKPETKRFSICIESASWVVGSSSQGPGVLLLSATFRVTELKSGRTARYEIRRAALAVFSLPLPIGGGNSTSEGNPVTFETLKYRQGSEMTAEDFATSVNVAYRSAGVGPVTIWPAEFDLEFLDIPNPSVKDKHMRSGGTFGWLKVPKLRPGEVRSSPGVEGGSAARVPFLKKSTQ